MTSRATIAAAVEARTVVAAELRRSGLTYDQIAARLGVGRDTVTICLRRAGMTSGGRRRFDYAPIIWAILAGQRYADIASALGMSYSSVGMIARVTGTRSPRTARREVPCPACGGKRGRDTLLCAACDRRKWRNGLCPCGRPKRYRRPCECGAVHVQKEATTQ